MNKLNLYHSKYIGSSGKLIMSRLIHSGIFRLKCDPSLPSYQTSSRRFRKNFHTCRLNDIVFGFDTWDKDDPTSLGDDTFDQLDCIFKTSYNSNLQNLYQKTIDRYNLKVFNYPIFHYEKLLSFEKKIPWSQSTKQNLCFFSGNMNAKRKNRHHWLQYLKEKNFWRNFKADTNWENDFIQESQNCMWGLILEGLGGDLGDAKNRRTIYYAANGYPLILNFQPEYPIPFIPDKDYIYVKQPDDLRYVSMIGPQSFAKQSKIFYNNILSPLANAKYLIKTINKLKGLK